MKALTFVCSDCQEQMAVSYGIWEDGELRLVGKCNKCGIIVRFSADKMTIQLLKEARSSERVN